MKRHPMAASLLGMGLLASMGAVAGPWPTDDIADEDRKTPPEPAPQPNLITDANRPGETNRQFAARMKAEKASGVSS